MYLNKIKMRGFTLIEILVALSIFTIVAVIMAHALHTIFSSQAGTEKRAARLADLQLATLLLSHDLEQVINRPILNAKGLSEPALQGTPYDLAFTHAGLANPTGQTQRASLQRTHYFLEKNNLMRQIWPVLDQTKTTLPLSRKILDEVSELRFEYLDSKGFFSTTWPSSTQTKNPPLPRAIRVTLTLKGWGKISQLYLLTAPAEVTTHA